MNEVIDLISSDEEANVDAIDDEDQCVLERFQLPANVEVAEIGHNNARRQYRLSGTSCGDESMQNTTLDNYNGLLICFQIEIQGPPKALPRPAFMSWLRNGVLMRRVVQPACSDLNCFKNKFKHQLQDKYGIEDRELPMYNHGCICVSIGFYQKLPQKSFVNSDPSRGLKLTTGIAPNTVSYDLKRPDIDNLAKFVLDALTGVVYRDNDQVVHLHLFKLTETAPPYLGQTIVRFCKVEERGHSFLAPNYFNTTQDASFVV